MSERLVVRTPEELERALASEQATEIAVEGDASLIALARGHAASAPPSRASGWRRAILAGLAIAAVLVAAAYVLHAGLIARAIGLLPAVPALGPDRTMAFARLSAANIPVQWGWVGIALVATYLIYRIIMRALDSDRNVELSWTVSEQVSGKLILKKVPVAVPHARSTRPPT